MNLDASTHLILLEEVLIRGKKGEREQGSDRTQS